MHLDDQSLFPFWRAWGPAFLWAGVISYSSSIIITPGMYPAIPNGDKYFHMAEFFVYGCFVQRAALQRLWPKGWKGWACVLAIIAMTGVLDELHQLFVPTRTCDVFDALADTFGGAIGMMSFRFVLRRRR